MRPAAWPRLAPRATVPRVSSDANDRGPDPNAAAGASGETSGELAGRVAIVTGGGWNIGRAIAERLAASGAKVVVAGRRAQLLDETVQAIEEQGGTALAVPTDCSREDEVARLVERTVAAFGTVDALVAMAGGGMELRRLEDTTPELWDAIFRQNLLATALCTRAVLPILRAKNAGVVLTCSGGGGYVPVLGLEINAYACIKAAIGRFTDQMTAELWETGIRINCIDPGKVLDRDRLRAIEEEERRTGTPHPERQGNRPAADAAELALWLVSDRSAPLRGRCLTVDDDWWRDPAKVTAVDATIHAFRLRRADY
jgi:3-oxoacyl-[acyl-carrier protein] reductase